MIYYVRHTKPKVLEGTQRRSVLMFSVIFAMNIAVGNTSLRWVSVNFNQVHYVVSYICCVANVTGIQTCVCSVCKTCYRS